MKQINLLVAAFMLTVVSAFANQTYDWIQTTLSIRYAGDGVTEILRMETDYDNDGREVGYRQYDNGALSLQYRDYQYNGRTITCWYDYYSGSTLQSSNKMQRTYSDNNWIQMTQMINYATDGVTETMRWEYDYDNDGRETGFRFYSDGALLQQNRDYQYNGRMLTLWIDAYSGGNLHSSLKAQCIYFDKNWIQMTQQIQSTDGGITETQRQETDYDNDGREIGYRSYSNGVLSAQNRDYQYNGRTVTFWMDIYSDGNVQLSYKIQSVYKEPTGSTNIVETNNSPYEPNIVGYYSFSGVKLKQEPTKGMYIIVYDNGKTEKVVK